MMSVYNTRILLILNSDAFQTNLQNNFNNAIHNQLLKNDLCETKALLYTVFATQIITSMKTFTDIKTV